MTLQASGFFSLLFTVFCLPAFCSPAAQPEFHAADWAVLRSHRNDQRHVSSRGIVQTMLEGICPACGFSPEMAPEAFPAWRDKVREAMKKLMKFPLHAHLPAPVLVEAVQRDRYRAEKWEAYPFPGAAVPFLVLIPDTASAENPVPVVFCIPGSDQTKEELAAETSTDLSQPPVE